MASSVSLSDEDKEFLSSCEELLKDRYTENDEEFMKVYKAEASNPPIVDSWRVQNNSGRRNEWRGNRSGHNNHNRHGHGHGGRHQDARHQDARRTQRSSAQHHPYNRASY